MGYLDLSALHVLIVDDNKHMRTILKTLLRALGLVNIRESEDAAQAFAELKQFPVDIIICDWEMEPLDGIDFTRLVRTAADSVNPFVPIILLTGHTELSRVKEARDAGITEFLAKPVSAVSLRNRMEAVILNPRPFIRSRHYVGPDRRRKARAYDGPERRADARRAGEAADAGGRLSQAEVEALLDE